MTRYYCDKCKKEFHTSNLDEVRIEGYRGLCKAYYLEERMLCNDCSTEILNIIDGKEK